MIRHDRVLVTTLALAAWLTVPLTAPAVELENLFDDNEWLVDSGQDDAFLGASVRTAGDVNGDGYSDVIVGAPYCDGAYTDAGCVRIYLGTENGLETTPDWQFYGSQSSARLGWSVSAAGDVNGDGFDDVVVGAPWLNGALTDEGRIYVFYGSATGMQTAFWSADLDEEGALFGYSVSWAGDVNGDGYDDIIAGAPEWGGFGSPFYIFVQGRARVYHGSPTGPVSAWTRSGGEEDIRFGVSVSTAGDVNGDGFDDVVVGADGYDPGVIDTDHGIARLYLGSASGLASSPAEEWVGSLNGERLGYSVSTAGDVDGDGYGDLVLGSPYYNGGQGRLTLLLGSASGPPSTGITLLPYGASERLGFSVATAGDVNGDGYADITAGAIDGDYVYLWYGKYTGTPSSPKRVQGSGDLGWSVGPAGDVNGDGFGDLIAGAPNAGPGLLEYGHAIVWHGTTHLFSAQAGWAGTGDAFGDAFGSSVASAGDVNGDGYDDVIVGSPGASAFQPAAGKAEIFLGTITGLALFPGWGVDGGVSGGNLGGSVAGAGDVNGDGYADVIVGVPGENTVRVFHGSATIPSLVADWSFTEASGAEFGGTVAGVGDVDGDGYMDVAVGDPGFNGDQGRVRVFFGSSSGVMSTGFVDLTEGTAGARFGASVAGAGDVDRDGFAEIVVGAPGLGTVTYPGCGHAFVFHGSSSGVGPGWDWSGFAEQADAEYGASVASAGDLVGAGYCGIVVGAPGYDLPGFTDSGAAFYLTGGSGGLSGNGTQFVLPFEFAGGERAGTSVASVGDFNADGISDVIVGVPDPVVGQGWVQLYVELPPAGTEPDRSFIDGIHRGLLGTSVAGAGDVNGDGVPDVLVGVPDHDGGTGAALVFYGNRHGDSSVPVSRIRGVFARQLTTTGDPIALGGLGEEEDKVRLEAVARSAAGRTQARLEIQMTSVGLGYGASFLGSETDTGQPDPGGSSQTTLGLNFTVASDTQHHWRARIRTDNPYFPRSFWVSNAPHVPGLVHFRTGTGVTSVGDGPEPVPAPAFRAVVPNPSPGTVRMTFAVPGTGPARLEIVDVRGRLVRSVLRGPRAEGVHTVSWDGRDEAGRRVASGLYFARLSAAGETVSRRILRVR